MSGGTETAAASVCPARRMKTKIAVVSVCPLHRNRIETAAVLHTETHSHRSTLSLCSRDRFYNHHFQGRAQQHCTRGGASLSEDRFRESVIAKHVARWCGWCTQKG